MVVADVPPKVTVLTPCETPKPLPVIVTVSPIVADVGLTVLMSGLIVRFVALDPVPPIGVVTLIGPLDPAAGTVAWMLVSESTVKVVAGTLLNATAFVPVKLMPVRCTCVPEDPLVGANDEITGAGTKFAALALTPIVVVTVMGPIVALVGT
jgi:hypothetical protein